MYRYEVFVKDGKYTIKIYTQNNPQIPSQIVDSEGRIGSSSIWTPAKYFEKKFRGVSEIWHNINIDSYDSNDILCSVIFVSYLPLDKVKSNIGAKVINLINREFNDLTRRLRVNMSKLMDPVRFETDPFYQFWNSQNNNKEDN